jgi:anti-anti-sigma regulatory factor
MLRITKAFENDCTLIYKMEGKINSESLDVWAEEIDALKKVTGHQIILDFSQVWFMSAKAVDVLTKSMPNHLYLLNCPMEIRNMLHTAGLSTRILG